MTQASIRLAFDSGWSDGDPGNGRVRFDSPRIQSARHVYVNARDAQDTILDEWVPTWSVGDVLVIERSGREVNRIVAWVIGPVYHRGSYWRVPVTVRSVYGSFAANDELVMHHGASGDDGAPPMAPAAAQPVLPVQFTLAPGLQALAPLAPMALTAPPAPQLVAPAVSAPPNAPTHTTQGLTPMAPMAPGESDRERQLAAENQALQDIIARLVSDDTEVYVVEGNA